MTDYRDYYNLTLKQIEDKVKEISNIENAVNLTLQKTFKIAGNFDNYSASILWLGRKESYKDFVKNKSLTFKVDLIESFIEKFYPENKLQELEKREIEIKKWINEEKDKIAKGEAKIAEAFKELLKREHEFNEKIINHLTEKN
jgi:hypothetical protein